MSVKVSCKSELYYFCYEGIVTSEDIKETVLTQILDHTYLTIYDFRFASLKELDQCDVSELGEFIEKEQISAGDQIERCAIIVQNELDYGIMRCLTTLCCEFTNIKIGIFYNLDEAIHFLTKK